MNHDLQAQVTKILAAQAAATKGLWEVTPDPVYPIFYFKVASHSIGVMTFASPSDVLFMALAHQMADLIRQLALGLNRQETRSPTVPRKLNAKMLAAVLDAVANGKIHGQGWEHLYATVYETAINAALEPTP